MRSATGQPERIVQKRQASSPGVRAALPLYSASPTCRMSDRTVSSNSSGCAAVQSAAPVGTVLPDLQPRKVIGGQVGTGGVQDFIVVRNQPGAAGRKAAVISLDGAEIQHLGRQNGIRQSAVRVGKQGAGSAERRV